MTTGAKLKCRVHRGIYISAKRLSKTKVLYNIYFIEIKRFVEAPAQDFLCARSVDLTLLFSLHVGDGCWWLTRDHGGYSLLVSLCPRSGTVLLIKQPMVKMGS